MPDKELKSIADKADMIIAGYSFTKDQEGFIRVLNLENPEEACLLQKDGEMLYKAYTPGYTGRPQPGNT